jgi:hypothetical protein
VRRTPAQPDSSLIRAAAAASLALGSAQPDECRMRAVDSAGPLASQTRDDIRRRFATSRAPLYLTATRPTGTLSCFSPSRLSFVGSPAAPAIRPDPGTAAAAVLLPFPCRVQLPLPFLRAPAAAAMPHRAGRPCPVTPPRAAGTRDRLASQGLTSQGLTSQGLTSLGLTSHGLTVIDFVDHVSPMLLT